MVHTHNLLVDGHNPPKNAEPMTTHTENNDQNPPLTTGTHNKGAVGPSQLNRGTRVGHTLSVGIHSSHFDENYGAEISSVNDLED